MAEKENYTQKKNKRIKREGMGLREMGGTDRRTRRQRSGRKRKT